MPGKKYIDKPLYILTSGFTFSGGEAFAYSLQQAQKAKVIGEITGGGAHPVTFQQISENIRFRIPNRRSINPITLSNWEGTGVIPDVQLEQEKAFDYAYTEALHIVREKYKDKPHYAFLVTEIDSVLETR
ncbi:S41 family peptidase [Caldalkalibacillus mannanilyticus]|uniref:S41 family peptidase n=1 Tax=Caldalkalibacillus mannanilyticus TaxID=1418 RepID=UPI00046A87A4|nr:S41 family peptidase [Caldalkalibacillus mannanilyticus]